MQHLTTVLCNAAREYYESHNDKDDFLSHDFQIQDVESGNMIMKRVKKILKEIFNKKKNIFDPNELSNIGLPS